VGGVAAEAVVADAERWAGQLLGHCTPRWDHSAGVAKTAAGLVHAVRHDEAEVLVAAAWLHDIGYAAELVDTGFHSLDGARYLRARGVSDRLCRLVANHTAAWVEAEARGLAESLAAEFPAELSPVADALTYADLVTGPAGQPLGVDQRIAEILERYEAAHVVHRSIRRATPELLATVRRVEDRVARVVATKAPQARTVPAAPAFTRG